MKSNNILDLNQLTTDLRPKVIALGNFDGIHLGHKSLINRTVEISQKFNIKPSILFFKNNSKNITLGQKEYITSPEDKIDIAQKNGIEIICLVEFDKSLMQLEAEEFLRDILIKRLNVKHIVVGKDYRFGKKAIGDISYLLENQKRFNYRVDILNLLKDHDKKINSTDIRQLIKNGRIKQANSLLGHPYMIRGKVVHGEKRGRNLGYPTANISLDFNYIIPKNGVYITAVIVDNKKYFAMTDVGYNPTFENEKLKIETYIFDFNCDIYSKEIKLCFLEFVRGDYTFKNVTQLINQLKFDEIYIRRRLKTYKIYLQNMINAV